ncbi:MAG: adenylate kinase [Chloroflexi bacterium]|nr:adenylate kinase [Chloroflexota bacterium]
MALPDRPFYVVLMGPPGAGKGTQSAILENEMGLKRVASGDLFRENLVKGTPMGVQAKSYMDRGELVPDDVTVGMIRERLTRSDCQKGAILDGFPRTLPQAYSLDRMLGMAGRRINIAISISVPDEVIMERMTGRRVCRAYGHVYHVIFNPSKDPQICDVDGSELYQRDDDKEDTVRNRLYVYYKQTAPLIGYYFAKGVLVEMDGNQPIEEVHGLLGQIMASQA